MPSYVRTPALWLVIGVLTSAVAGCGQSVASHDDRPAPDASTDDSRDERQASYDQRDSDGSAVKQASAESRIEPRRDAAADPDRDVPATTSASDTPVRLSATDAPLPLDNVDAAQLSMPKVSLTEHHAATCLVGVGDAFPDFKLPDPSGRQTALSDRYGDKLTLVVFWHGKEPTALEELADLARYFQPRFGDQGLSIVTIDTGDDAQLAGELAKHAGAQDWVLCDVDGSAFKQVATDRIPRTYLLDASGKILWFDLEYSPTTSRELTRAIRYTLAHP